VGLHKTVKQNVLSRVKLTLQYRSSCFGVNDDLKREPHSLSAGLPRLLIITYACISAGVGRAFSRVCLSVCLSALLQENCLSYQHQTWYTYQSLGTYGARGQKVKGQGHTVRKPSRRTVACDYSGCLVTLCCVTCGRCRRGSACRYDCLCFLVSTQLLLAIITPLQKMSKVGTAYKMFTDSISCKHSLCPSKLISLANHTLKERDAATNYLLAQTARVMLQPIY